MREIEIAPGTPVDVVINHLKGGQAVNVEGVAIYPERGDMICWLINEYGVEFAFLEVSEEALGPFLDAAYRGGRFGLRPEPVTMSGHA